MIDDANEIRALLTGQCTEEQFQQMRCPKCSQTLTLTVHENKKNFFVRCSNDSTHLSFQGVCESPHEWRTRLVGAGWY